MAAMIQARVTAPVPWLEEDLGVSARKGREGGREAYISSLNAA